MKIQELGNMVNKISEEYMSIMCKRSSKLATRFKPAVSNRAKFIVNRWGGQYDDRTHAVPSRTIGAGAADTAVTSGEIS